MKNDHAQKVWDDAQVAKGPLDKEEKKSTDGVSGEVKEGGADEARSESTPSLAQKKKNWVTWVRVRLLETI